MNNAAAIIAVQRALARFRRRQAHTPTNHSAREIAQMSMLVEFLFEAHTHDVDRFIDLNRLSSWYDCHECDTARV